MPAIDAAEPVSEPAAPTLQPLSWLLLPSPPLPAPPVPAPPAPPLLVVTAPLDEVVMPPEVLVLPPLLLVLLEVLVLPLLLDVLEDELLERPHCVAQLPWRHCTIPTNCALLLHAVVWLLRQPTQVVLLAQAVAWLQQELVRQVLQVGSCAWRPQLPPEELEVLPPHSAEQSVVQAVLQMQLRMLLYAFCPVVPAAVQQLSAQV